MLLIVVRVELGAERHLLVREPGDHVARLHIPQLDISESRASVYDKNSN